MRIVKKVLGIGLGLMVIMSLGSCKGEPEEIKAIDNYQISMGTYQTNWETVGLDEISTKTSKDIEGITYIFVGFKANKIVKLNSITYTFNNTKNYDSERLADTSFFYLIGTEELVKESNDITQHESKNKQTVDLNTSPLTIEIGKAVGPGETFQCVIAKGGEWSNISIDWKEL